MELSLARLVNLIYYSLVRNMNQEQRDNFDRILERTVKPLPVAPTSRARRAPVWWKGDAGAAASSIAAARSLGFNVMEQT